MNNKKTKNLTLLALFIAIEAVMVMVPFLGFIPIGPLRATLLPLRLWMQWAIWTR